MTHLRSWQSQNHRSWRRRPSWAEYFPAWRRDGCSCGGACRRPLASIARRRVWWAGWDSRAGGVPARAAPCARRTRRRGAAAAFCETPRSGSPSSGVSASATHKLERFYTFGFGGLVNAQRVYRAWQGSNLNRPKGVSSRCLKCTVGKCIISLV